jgi:ABC-type proline/glycine betaine transport system ATPase subunit
MKSSTKQPQVKPVAVARFEAEVQQKIQHLVRVMSLVEEVNNEQDKAMVSAAIKEGKELIKKVGVARKAITAPLQEQVKQWIAKEKELLLPVEEAIQNADKLVQAFNAQVARQQQEMLDQIARQEAEQLKTAEEKDTEQVRQESEFRRQLAEAQHQTDGIRKVWAFELQDLSQVPREYLVLDEKKVRQAIRSGERAIPGISRKSIGR